MTKSEVSKLVAILMACYPGMQFPPGTVLAYENFLIDLDHERAKRAVESLVRTKKFMPAIAEIVAAYEGEKATDEIPYHRQFRPAPQRGLMSNRELKAELDAYLAKDKPPAPPAAPAAEEPAS